ncbi:hypothetical protein EW026_g6694 [Hermanssonia centrifuga]|uniref:LysM domain-containing protein n=1 Tax=Hermanssonia centrifuga TaxID=98765 RepID=A0A4S4KA79_9APHY|nr:hypothetical protein EW026_g6694 [Hermanssonia centrifuga]
MFSRIQLIAFTLAAALCGVNAQIQLPADCARNYTVRLGDTCNAISAELDVSTFQLAYVNNATIDAACDNLALGEPLCLGITGQDCDVVRVVEDGDSCAVIVGDAGVELSVLLANNPNVNSECSNIYVGEVLCTAEGVIPYTN